MNKTNFPVRLKELRQRKKVSQSELGSFLSLDKSTISLYESGKREPDFETIKKIADFFNVSTDYLLGKDTPTNQQKDPVEENWPEVLQVLRRSGKKPTAQERKKIAKIIETAIEAITED